MLSGDLTYVAGSAALGSAPPSGVIFTVNPSPPSCLTDVDVIVQVFDITGGHWQGEFATIKVNSGATGGTIDIYDKNTFEGDCAGRRPSWVSIGDFEAPDEAIWAGTPSFIDDFKAQYDLLTIAIQTGGGGCSNPPCELEKPGAVPATWQRVKGLYR